MTNPVGNGEPSKSVAKTFGAYGRSIFRWLADCASGGQKALQAKSIPRRRQMVVPEEMRCLAKAIMVRLGIRNLILCRDLGGVPRAYSNQSTDRTKLMRFAIIMVAFTSLAAHADTPLELNIYGLSHHWDRAEAQRLHTEHETNPGLGLRYELAPHEWCAAPFAEGGIYSDSGANTTYYAALGCKGLKLTDSIRLGAGIALMQSETYNHGRAFVAPVPLLTWQISKVTLNFIQYPRIDSLGIINTTGLYISVPLP
ncbi:MAG TPA: hypothetical protein VEP67_03825 [Thiobacillaceae bacterium]|nr:hypothetical protein [Thiobacillaceae bacterium]